MNRTSDSIANLTAVFCLVTTKLCLCVPKVFLLPSVLAQKRVWNPKYPICIQLARAANTQEDEGGRSGEEIRGEEQGAEPSSPKQSSSKPAHEPQSTLYLFGRTGREKEEWFRHFLLASMDAEREKDRDRQRPGRCVSRSGMRDVNNALEKRSLLDKASIQMLYVCGLWITCSNSLHFKANPFSREHTDLTVVW